MIEELRKLAYASIGTAAIVCEKSEAFIKEMVEKGKLTVDEGKELSQELKKDVMDKTTEAASNVMSKLDEMKFISKDEVVTLIESYDFVNRQEIFELKERIRVLEEKLNNQQ